MPLDCAKELGYSQDWHCAEQYFFPFLCVICTESVAIRNLPYHLSAIQALIICCDAVTTCDYTIYSFVIPEYKLTYYIFWMALQCSLHCIPLKIYAVISNKNMTFNNTQCSCFQITRHVSTRSPQFQLI